MQGKVNISLLLKDVLLQTGDLIVFNSVITTQFNSSRDQSQQRNKYPDFKKTIEDIRCVYKNNMTLFFLRNYK